MSATPNPCAPRTETDPLYLRSGSNVSLRGASEFKDAAHWGELAGKHLSRFNLPGWNVPCSPQEMCRWLDRLNLSERDHLTMTATSFKDFCQMNPTWPLRAFIGLACELVAEARH